MNGTQLTNFRQQYPQYNDLDDLAIIQGLRKKYPQYSDLSDDQFMSGLENKYTAQREPSGVSGAYDIKPEAIPFAIVIISGSIPYQLQANILPVRPKPLCTSSIIKNILFSVQYFLSALINFLSRLK